MKALLNRGSLPSNLPPPPTGLPKDESLPTDTITIVMGKEKSLGIGLNNDNIVTSLTPTSVAGKSGLRLGDVVMGWQGQPLRGRKLQEVLMPAPVHILSVSRGGVLFQPLSGNHRRKLPGGGHELAITLPSGSYFAS